MITGGHWEKLTLAADSGAVDHVIMKNEANSVKMHETSASKAGFCYRAANGSKIQNYGEKHIDALTNEGNQAALTVQVADVKRNLGSVVKMMDEGNKVVFDNTWSYIQNKKSGRTTTMHKQNGLMQFDIWIPRTGDETTTRNQFNALIDEDEKENTPSETKPEKRTFRGLMDVL